MRLPAPFLLLGQTRWGGGCPAPSLMLTAARGHTRPESPIMQANMRNTHVCVQVCIHLCTDVCVHPRGRLKDPRCRASRKDAGRWQLPPSPFQHPKVGSRRVRPGEPHSWGFQTKASVQTNTSSAQHPTVQTNTRLGVPIQVLPEVAAWEAAGW